MIPILESAQIVLNSFEGRTKRFGALGGRLISKSADALARIDDCAGPHVVGPLVHLRHASVSDLPIENIGSLLKILNGLPVAGAPNVMAAHDELIGLIQGHV